jgi:quinol monooxygenase YgiN
MPPVSYTVVLHAAAGRRDDVLAVLAELVEAAGDEPGTLVYAMHTVDGEPDVVVSYELFVDEAALRAHTASEAVARAVDRLQPLVAQTVAYRGAPASGKGLPV